MELEKALSLYKTLVEQEAFAPVMHSHPYGDEIEIHIPPDNLNQRFEFKHGLRSALDIAHKNSVELTIDHNGWAVLK